jgi:carboxyl-terminal processing protease
MKNFKRSLLGSSILAILLLALAFKFNLFATTENIYDQIQRFMEVIQAVKKLYVEEVDSKKLVDGAIIGMLEQLDPHSVYIPEDRMKEVSEQFEGEFEGIGIEFIVHNKIPTIVAPIADSPSERLGLRPGDKIIKIQGVSTYGITEQAVRDQLLGPEGTKVTITVQRPGIEEPFDVTITRDRIPIYSVSAYFMIDDKAGYIRVGRFAKTTSDEFEKALRELESMGMKRLILDLRGNSGGFLDQAVEMADKFIDGGKRVVYTRGRIPSANEDYYSTTEATHAKYPLIVLINHGSASASEIVAGAIQDWDRGLIVGVTSFGKGLVQHQLILKDGSAIRVTVARYFTPSGRLIQRSYENGLPDYIAEGYDDIDPNANSDSTQNKPVFTTSAGRKVYGGGGITPDITVKSKLLTLTTIRLIRSQLFFEYGSVYATKHRKLSKNFKDFRDNFIVDDQMLKEFKSLAVSEKIEIDNEEFDKDISFIKRRIKSQIARHLWSSREYHQVEVMGDDQVLEAMKFFSQAAKIAGLKLDG